MAVPAAEDKEEIMRAVNLIGFMNTSKMTEHLPLWLVLRPLLTDSTVQPVPARPGHDAVLVRDDVSEEQWRAIVAIIRQRFDKANFPLWERGSRGGWKMI